MDALPPGAGFVQGEREGRLEEQRPEDEKAHAHPLARAQAMQNSQSSDKQELAVLLSRQKIKI